MASKAFCAVTGCSLYAVFRLPGIPQDPKTDQQKYELSKKRRNLWLARINRKDLTVNQLREVNSTLRVCGKHFHGGKPASLYESTHADWAPSLHLGYETQEIDPCRSARARKRSYNQVLLNELTEDAPSLHDDSFSEQETGNGAVECQTDLTSEFIDRILRENMLLRERIAKFKYDKEYFAENPKDVNYYTGLPDFEVCIKIFNYVEPGLKQSMLIDKFEQYIMCLMRLRLGTALEDLSKRFQISKTTASRIFLETIEVLYIYLKPLIVWPEKEDLQNSMPLCYREKFGKKITVIIDCFEIYIEQPKNLTARSLMWSTYKSHHTAKYLIGITPQGTISFISKGWGGRTSDKHITENSVFLQKLTHGDFVMADRGFTIEEPLGAHGAQLAIPAFTRGQTQLSPGEVERTRRIANVRIHVERVIGSLKQKYTFLDKTLPINVVNTRNIKEDMTCLDQIVVICCALVNICPSVVPLE